MRDPDGRQTLSIEATKEYAKGLEQMSERSRAAEFHQRRNDYRDSNPVGLHAGPGPLGVPELRNPIGELAEIEGREVHRSGILDDPFINAATLGMSGSARTGGEALRIGAGAFGGAAEATVLRTIVQGERVAALVNEVKSLTWSTGLEHAIVSLRTGERVLVAGGETGMSFGSLAVRRLLLHSNSMVF